MVLAGLTTFVLVSVVLRDRSTTTDVWMLAVDVPAGASVDADVVMSVPIPADDPLLSSLLVSADGLPSGIVRHGLTAGDPLLASDLGAVGQTAVGRTFTVPVGSLVLDGLALNRGDRLDLIGLDASGAMHYVVTDVEVVRLPAPASSSAFSAARSRDAWVTIQVDDREALRLSEVLAHGPIELVRSTGAEVVPARGTSPADAGLGS